MEVTLTKKSREKNKKNSFFYETIFYYGNNEDIRFTERSICVDIDDDNIVGSKITIDLVPHEKYKGCFVPKDRSIIFSNTYKDGHYTDILHENKEVTCEDCSWNGMIRHHEHSCPECYGDCL